MNGIIVTQANYITSLAVVVRTQFSFVMQNCYQHFMFQLCLKLNVSAELVWFHHLVLPLWILV